MEQKEVFKRLPLDDRLKFIVKEGQLVATRWYGNQQFELFKVGPKLFQVIYEPFSDKVLNVHERSLDEGCLHFYAGASPESEMRRIFEHLGIKL